MTRRVRALLVVVSLVGVSGCATSGALRPNGGPPSVVAAAVLDEADELRGTRYAAGGVSPTGFDCSGFVQYLYGRQGIPLPRTAQAQFSAGTRIRANRLRPGDLVFFRISGRRVTHVGLAVGDGQFIHAPNVGSRVRIDRLDAPYWARRFAGARRVAR